MATYRYVNCEYWTDVDILNFSPDEKLFYIYLLTNSHTKQCGIYEISIKHMEFETGYTGEVVKSLLHRFEKTYKKIKYNYITKEIAIKNWVKYHTSTSPKVIKCINEELKNIKDLSLIAYVCGNGNPCNKEIEESPTPQDEKDTSVEAIKEASIRNKPYMKYIYAILMSWLNSKERKYDSYYTRDSEPSSYDELILSS